MQHEGQPDAPREESTFVSGRRGAEQALRERDFALARDVVMGLIADADTRLVAVGDDLDSVMELEKDVRESLGRLSRGMLMEFAAMLPDELALQEASEATAAVLERIAERRRELIFESVGLNARKTHDLLLAEHPELSRIDVGAEPPEGTMSHRHADFSNPEIIMVQTDDAFYEGAMTNREASVRIMAELIGVPFEELTREHLKVFILAHEYGHAHDVLNNFGDEKVASKAFKEKRKEEMASLPVPDRSPARFARLVEEVAWDKLIEEYPQLAGKEPQEAIEEQERAYRTLPSETYADNFAADFMKSHENEFEF